MFKNVKNIKNYLEEKYKISPYNWQNEHISALAYGIYSLYQKVDNEKFESSYNAFLPFISSISDSYRDTRPINPQINDKIVPLILHSFINWEYDKDHTKRYKNWKKITENIIKNEQDPKINEELLNIIKDLPIQKYSNKAINFILSEKSFIIEQYYSNPSQTIKFLNNIHNVKVDLLSVPNKVKSLIYHNQDLIHQLLNTKIPTYNNIYSTYKGTKTAFGDFSWINENKAIDEKIITALVQKSFHERINIHNMTKQNIKIWHKLIENLDENIIDLAYYAKKSKNNEQKDIISDCKSFISLKSEIQSLYPDKDIFLIYQAAIFIQDNRPSNNGLLNIITYHLMNNNWQLNDLYSNQWKKIEPILSKEDFPLTNKQGNFNQLVKNVKHFYQSNQKPKKQQKIN